MGEIRENWDSVRRTKGGTERAVKPNPVARSESDLGVAGGIVVPFSGYSGSAQLLVEHPRQ
jgi:uncharacterized membrane protein